MVYRWWFGFEGLWFTGDGFGFEGLWFKGGGLVLRDYGLQVVVWF